MNDADQDLRRRFRDDLPLSDASACPPADLLWDVAAGAAPFARLSEVVDHAVHCAQCSEALRIARDVRAALPRGAPALPTVRRAFPLLAAVGLAACLTVVLRMRSEPVDPGTVERGGSGGNPTDALRALSPDHQHPGAVTLRWSPHPAARSYNVTVLTPELTVVHQVVGLAEQQLTLPPAVAQPGAAGQLLWNVDAVLADGRTVTSPTFRVHVE